LKLKLALVMFVALAFSQIAAADGVVLNYSFGNYAQDNILNAGIAGNFDLLTMAGTSGTQSATFDVPFTTTISVATWIEGTTCTTTASCVANSTENGTASFSATINGVTHTIHIPFTACLAGGFSLCAGSDDTIQFFASSPVIFDLTDGSRVTLTSLDMAQIVGSLSGGVTQEVQGTFVATPEPGTLALLGLGSLGLGRVVRKRRI
jgi:hypothetical protein